jgi:hypothetical protein
MIPFTFSDHSHVAARACKVDDDEASERASYRASLGHELVNHHVVYQPSYLCQHCHLGPSGITSCPRLRYGPRIILIYHPVASRLDFGLPARVSHPAGHRLTTSAHLDTPLFTVRSAYIHTYRDRTLQSTGS